MRTGAFLLVGLLMLTPRSAEAIGELNGRIAGTVTAKENGKPLAGIDIKVSGPALIGGPRTLVSNDDGSYEVIELPPGIYDVEVGFPGTVLTRRRIEVRQGQTAPLNIVWSAQLEEVQTYHVVEERHPTNPDSTQTGAIVTKDQEARLATGRNYDAMMQQAAGTVNAEGEGGGNYQVKGGSPFMNHYLMDGLDLTDPVTNTSSGAFNFDSIQSEQIMTGGFEAQYNSLGGVVNVISAGGSDQLHVDSSFYINNAKLRVAEQFAPNLYNRTRPFYGSYDTPPNESYLFNFNISGPLLRQRLWYNVSFEYSRSKNSTLVGPPLNLQHPPQYRDSFRPRFKLQWAPQSKHLITVSAFADPSYFNNYRQGNSSLGVAENHIEAGGVFAIGQWDYFHSKNLNTNVQIGFQLNHFDFGPQGHFGSIDNNNDGSYSKINNTYDPNRPQHTNNDDGTVWYQGDGISIDRRWGATFDPSVSLRGKWLGQHDAKMGIQSRFIYHSFHGETPGGVTYSDAGGGGLENGLCDPATGKGGCSQRTWSPPYDQHQWGFGAGAYIQDRWKPARIKRLTVLPGMRIDYGITKNTFGQTVSSLLGYGPRLGGTFDITGDQRTIFTAYYGRSNETLSLMATGQADYQSPTTTEQYDKATNTWKFLRSSGGTGGYLTDKHLTPPHADEVELGLRRELFKGTLASVTYTYKRLSNIWDSVEVNQVWNAAGTQVVRFKDGNPLQIYRITTPDLNYRNYQGIDFEYESRPNDNFDLYLAYTLSWTYGPGGEELGFNGVGGQFYNPRQLQFYDGFLQQDARHNIKVRASYSWHGFTAGVFANYRTGTPLRRFYYNPYDGGYTMLRSPQGTEPGAGNDVKAIGEFRLPPILQLDMRAQYDFHELIRHHVSIIFDFFNLLNLREAGGDFRGTIEQSDIPTFGVVTSRQAAFHLQIGLRYVR
jgi:hypothetical protein